MLRALVAATEYVVDVRELSAQRTLQSTEAPERLVRGTRESGVDVCPRGDGARGTELIVIALFVFLVRSSLGVGRTVAARVQHLPCPGLARALGTELLLVVLLVLVCRSCLQSNVSASETQGGPIFP